MRSTSPRSSRSNPRGFTLVEIMVVVVIIGLLAALAIPAFQRVQRASQNARVISDYRTFAQAFEIYNSQNGGWPPNASGGAVPAGMSKDFKEDNWKAAATVIGGRWNWDFNRPDFVAGISIQNPTITMEQLQEIDAKLDDGNLATGLFVYASSRASYILEANP